MEQTKTWLVNLILEARSLATHDNNLEAISLPFSSKQIYILYIEDIYNDILQVLTIKYTSLYIIK